MGGAEGRTGQLAAIRSALLSAIAASRSEADADTAELDDLGARLAPARAALAASQARLAAAEAGQVVELARLGVVVKNQDSALKDAVLEIQRSDAARAVQDERFAKASH